MEGPGAPRRITLVSRVRRNSYVSLLCEGLRLAGLDPEVVEQFSLGWMWRNRRRVDVLHIHWLELLLVYPTLGRSLRRWLSVVLGLFVARHWHVCVVYTVHNIEPHEGQRAALVRLGNQVMMALAQAVHVHDEGTAQLLAERWGRRRGVYVIPHGSYVGAYPNTCTRAEARQRLGLEEGAFVYLFLGRVRPYKGIEELLEAFRSLDDGDTVLLIAGEVHEPEYEQRVRELAAGDGRIRLSLRFVADEELQLFLNACDVCVLPYRHVTMSGATMLSFSFGTPVVAPRMGCFTYLVGQGEERGVFYEAGGLAGALRRARLSDLGAKRAACRDYVRSLDWETVARQHAAMYAQCQ